MTRLFKRESPGLTRSMTKAFRTNWDGSWKKVHNLQIFNFGFFILMENNQRKKPSEKFLSQHKVTALFVTRVLHGYVSHVMPLIAVFTLCGSGHCVHFLMSRPKY